jgi:hypothetical protein
MKKILAKIVLFLEKYVAFVLLHILNWTLRYDVTGNAGKPLPIGIYCFWHRYIIPQLLYNRHEGIGVLISASRDGDYIAEPAKLFGYVAIRGSSNKQGTAALKEMIRLSKHHALAITPDGPKGPVYQVKEGVLQLAYLTKLPIYACNVYVSKTWTFKSWDRFIYPKPFAHVQIRFSEPIYVHHKEDFEPVKEILEIFMKDKDLL